MISRIFEPTASTQPNESINGACAHLALVELQAKRRSNDVHKTTLRKIPLRATIARTNGNQSVILQTLKGQALPRNGSTASGQELEATSRRSERHRQKRRRLPARLALTLLYAGILD